MNQISKRKEKGRKTSGKQPARFRGRFLCLTALLMALCLSGIPAVRCLAAPEDIPELYATSAVLLDGESGKVLYGKSEDTPMANASTTKIMTCITVLENCDLGEVLTVSDYASSMPKVKLYLNKGESYTVRELLYSLMLESHNDSAVALAEHVGKKWVPELEGKKAEDFEEQESRLAVKAFADAMNRKAVELGCSDTYFITPNGLDAVETVALEDGTEQSIEHHTTARDLAIIMSYCILSSPEREAFLTITRTPDFSFTENGRSFTCSNHNSFLGMMEGAISGKTGFTGKAGYCYVGALERDGRYFVVALLACGWPNNKSYKWTDTRKLMEYGLANFHRVNLLGDKVLYDEKNLPELPVAGGQGDFIGAKCSVPLRITGREDMPGDQGILMGDQEKVQVCVALKKELTAPVEKGMKVGEIRYVVGEEVYRTEDIVTDRGAEKIDFRWCMERILKWYFCPDVQHLP